MQRFACTLVLAVAAALPFGLPSGSASAQDPAPPAERAPAPAAPEASDPLAAEPAPSEPDASESDPNPSDPNPSDQEGQYLVWAQALWDSLERRDGRIELPGGVATLDVPPTFYYLGPADAAKILVEVWGNPPSHGEGVLGMLFPAGTTPFDPSAWAVVIGYEQDGYVSDKDAADIDYDALLVQMRESAQAANAERVADGFEPIELVGWAARPYYDQASHKLHWARELKIGDHPEHTLNYGIRVLGRKGVLVLNFVAGMGQQDLIAGELDQVLAMASFDAGNRYEDFVPGVDQVAAYGIGGLIAGKVLAKVGFFAAALIFLKKFGAIALAALAGLGFKLWRGRKKPA